VIAVRNSLFPFLLVSTAFHLLLVLSWYGRPVRQPISEMIPVTVLSAPAKEKPVAPKLPRDVSPLLPRPAPPPKLSQETSREIPTRAELPPGQPAKESRSGAEFPAKSPQPLAENNETAEQPVNPRSPRAKRETIVASELPTLKDLLPPVERRPSAAGRSEKPIRLDSRDQDNRDPRLVAYLRGMQQALEAAWHNPDVARSVTRPYGLEGRAVMRIMIADDGQVENWRVIRTSGYAVLDQEANRVIEAASPGFGVWPRSIEKSPIDVTFIYENEGLTYTFAPR
jgi:periplasmic protein TonB